MNNQGRLLETSSKNRIIVFAIFIGLILITASINAQSNSEKIVFNTNQTDNYVVKYFDVKEVNNKLYFKFLVLENSDKVNYTLESSINGTDFYAVELKEGFKSPNGLPLLYCYLVDLNTLNDKIYRIRRDSPEGMNYSSIIDMNNNINLSLSAQKN